MFCSQNKIFGDSICSVHSDDNITSILWYIDLWWSGGGQYMSDCDWGGVLLAQWMILHFLSNPQARPRVPIEGVAGIDLYTWWLLLTCHSCGVACHSLAHSCDMCSLTLHAVHLLVLNHCSFRLCYRDGCSGLKGSNRGLIHLAALLIIDSYWRSYFWKQDLMQLLYFMTELQLLLLLLQHLCICVSLGHMHYNWYRMSVRPCVWVPNCTRPIASLTLSSPQTQPFNTCLAASPCGCGS